MADVKVLVYHYRAEGHPVVRNGLAVITHQELTDILAADQTLQFSTKAIPHLTRSIDIYQSDLHTASQAAAEPAGTHPNDGSNVASVTFPVKVILGIIAGTHKEIYILSKKTS
ncbi:uncharacterized protein RCC_01167 [Ramularia collo-cygni]|uniref:Uncharacterized protein n=1 Tax=Ramularia collo-cygni TaxID=112498 RepID=A0A2D3UYR0_9PEZI|nr:uncharacterized protein RCC_01167 [Ramularia collo-cygni]CZT15304.1 uncharacterized protein RCC_01167 [Ramularia collo-cygni]